MGSLDFLKWFLELAGINKKTIVVPIVLVVLSNLALYCAYDTAKTLLTEPLLVKILVHVFLTALILTSFVSMLFLLSKPRLKLKLGVYWDNQLNPHCPSCKKPLAGSPAGSNVLRCANCKEDFNLRFGPQFLSLDMATEKIKKGEL
jgi:LSD1 subclass zinc finger protein